MTKQEILTKLSELVTEPTCCSELREVADNYIKSQTKENKKILIEELREDIVPIDGFIEFLSSQDGRDFLGEERARDTLGLAKKFKAAGNKICFCPACQTANLIYNNRSLL